MTKNRAIRNTFIGAAILVSTLLAGGTASAEDNQNVVYSIS
jgi:outer membrane murein-binding lipoprotein Lpp